MKKWFLAAFAAVFLICIVACGKESSPVAGRVYTYEKEGFGGGDFAITINEDGTFHYYEGMFSSYIGSGVWEMNDSLITLIDDEYMGYPLENVFHFDGTNLIFVEKDSSNFVYVDVKDGEVFHGEPVSSDE